MNQLMTLDEAARLLRLRTAETFSRFARRYRIPLVKFGGRVVRVRVEDVDRAISEHTEHTERPDDTSESAAR